MFCILNWQWPHNISFIISDEWMNTFARTEIPVKSAPVLFSSLWFLWLPWCHRVSWGQIEKVKPSSTVAVANTHAWERERQPPSLCLPLAVWKHLKSFETLLWWSAVKINLKWLNQKLHKSKKKKNLWGVATVWLTNDPGGVLCRNTAMTSIARKMETKFLKK